MLRAGLFTLLVGPAAAALTDDCMKGLHELDGGSGVELSLRCRAAFGPDACKQARQSLGAQPWSHARMESSCKQFAAAYEGMDARTLEAAVATKTSMDGAVSAKVAPQPAATAPVPVQQPAEQQEGPVAGLLAKLKEKREEAEAQAEAAKGDHAENPPQEGPLAGLINKIKEAKAAHEAQETQAAPAEGDPQAQGPLAGLMNKMKEAKAAHEAQATQQGAPAEGDDQAQGPLAGLFNKIKEAKAEHDKSAAEVESDQQGPLADMFKHGEKAPVLKLYNEAQIEQPAAASGTRQVLGAFAGAASLAAVTLFVASRRVAAPVGHEQLSEQLDAEQHAE